MGKFILALVFAYTAATGMGLISQARGTEVSDAYVSCMERVLNGFESQAKWDECVTDYPSLPNPLRFKCVAALDKGFPSEAHMRLCILYFGTDNPIKWAREA